ncbi:MAG: GNAT family N-acetyltransferase [Candidatus Sericytochromatia bacterium]|nr:GNAT family N-acetyltransferase [Candidatus Tanganyikabacteria bacterium]
MRPPETLSPGFTVREAAAADGQAIRDLVYGVLAEYGLEPDPAATDADIQDVAASYGARGGVFEVVEDAGGRCVGTVGLYPLDDGVCELRKMYLARDARGHGLGKRLLARTVDRARALGFRRVELETASALVEAIGLYRRFGFQAKASGHMSPRCDQAFYLDLDTTGRPSSTDR